MYVPNGLNSFGVNFKYLEKKIKENHSDVNTTKTSDSLSGVVRNDYVTARDFARFKLHSTSDVIE